MNTVKTLLATTLATLVISLPAHGDCDLPAAPSKVPDGKTASEAEMRTSMDTVKEYNADVETYLKCLEFERKQNHLTDTEESRRRNAAVDTLQHVANKFNEQLKTFKSRTG